jgi:hypothetical protein
MSFRFGFGVAPMPGVQRRWSCAAAGEASTARTHRAHGSSGTYCACAGDSSSIFCRLASHPALRCSEALGLWLWRCSHARCPLGRGCKRLLSADLVNSSAGEIPWRFALARALVGSASWPDLPRKLLADLVRELWRNPMPFRSSSGAAVL